MQELWNCLESWLGINAPQVLKTLQPGATVEQIKQAEDFLEVDFPEHFKVSYRIHNGQVNFKNRLLNGRNGLLNGRELLSLEHIQNEWKVWKELLNSGNFEGLISEPEGAIRDDYWNEKWIPITYDGSWNHDCLDLNPAGGGTFGQIIRFWHDDPTRVIIADSFGSWLTAFVEGCESGKYVYLEEYGGIVDAEYM